MGNWAMFPTWDEYLVAMSNYLLVVGQAVHVDSKFPLAPPMRPADPIPDEYRSEAARLRDACDRVAAQVFARMEVIAHRPVAMRQSPHQEYPMASYLETDI